MPECRVCYARPVASTTVCRHCTDQAMQDLRAIAELAPEFDGKRAGVKAIRYDGDSTGGTRDVPLPYDPRVSDCERAALATLTSIARVCMDEAPEHLGSSWSPVKERVESLAEWLREFVAWLVTTEHGPEAVAEVAKVRASIEALFDRRPGLALVGPCQAPTDDGPCGSILYVRADDDGKPTRSTVTCRACKTEHDVDTARQRMHDAAAEHQVTAREIEALLHIAVRDVARMEEAGHLTPVGHLDVHTPRGMRTAKTYRLGDVQPAQDAYLRDRRDKRRRKGSRPREHGTSPRHE